MRARVGYHPTTNHLAAICTTILNLLTVFVIIIMTFLRPKDLLEFRGVNKNLFNFKQKVNCF